MKKHNDKLFNIDLSHYELGFSKDLFLVVCLVPTSILDLYIKSVNIQLSKLGEEYRIVQSVKVNDQLSELKTNLPYLVYLEKVYGVKVSLDSSVRDVYCQIYPNDYQREDIREDITFNDVWNGLIQGKDIYNVITDTFVDTEVRVRIFEILSVLKEYKYEEIWNLWLNKGEITLW